MTSPRKRRNQRWSKDDTEAAATIRDAVKNLCAGRTGQIRVGADVSCSFSRYGEIVHVSVWAGVPTRKVFSANWSMFPEQNGVMTFRRGPWIDVLLTTKGLRVVVAGRERASADEGRTVPRKSD